MANGTSLAGNVLINSANNIAGANTVLGITTYELDVLATANTTISARIGTAVAGSMALSGSGNVTLSATNAYTGTTYINSATLTEGVGSALSTGGVTVVGGTFDLNGNSDSVGAITATAGTIQTGAGTLTTTGTVATVANANLSSKITGTLTMPAAATLNIAEGLVENDAVISATITGAGTSLTKSTGTGVVVLSGNNTNAGTMPINAGTVKLGAAGSSGNGPLGTTAAGTTVASGAALDLNGYTLNNAEATTISGTGLTANVQGAILNNSAVAVSYSGTLTLGAASTIESDYGDVNLTSTGTVSGAVALTLRGGGDGSFAGVRANVAGSTVKNDLGTWTLSGNSQHTGVTTITLGVLKLGGAGSGSYGPLGTIGTGTTIASGAMLDLNGYTLVTAEALTSVSGTGIANAGAITTSSSSPTGYSGAITLAAASRLTNFGSGTFSISGALAGAYQLTLVSSPGTITQTSASAWTNVAGGFTKEGAGVAVLAGQNQFTSTVTVSTGTLRLGADGGATDTPLGRIGGSTVVALGAVLDLDIYTVGGASTWEPLTLNGTGLNNTGALISASSSANNFGVVIYGSNARVVNSGSGEITFVGAPTGTYNYVFGGSGPIKISGIMPAVAITITKFDSGTLTLNAANLQTGLIRINGGTVKYGVANAILTNAVTIDGGTLDINGQTDSVGAITLISGSISNTGAAATLTGTGYTFYGGAVNVPLGGTSIAMAKITGETTTVNATLSNTGTLTINAGKVQYLTNDVTSDTASVTVAGGTLDVQTYTDTFATLTLTSGSVIGSGAGTITGTATPAYVVSSGEISAILAGAVSLRKTTVGTVTLSGLNTYTGVTDIQGGTLSVSTIKNGGVACGLGQATNAAANLTSTTGTGTIQYTGGTDSTDRNITTTTAITLQIDVTNPSTSLTWSGATTNTTGLLNKVGPGTLILSGSNQHTGVTSALAGTLKYGADNVLLTGGVTVNNGTLDLNNYSDSVGAIILQNGGQIIDSGGTSAVLTSTAQFNFQSGRVSARLGSGVAAGLSKTTTDRVILSGDNTFTSTSVALSAGALNLQHDNALGASGTTMTTTVTGGANAVLELQNNVTIPSAKIFTINGTGVNQEGAIRNIADSNIISGTIALGSTGVRINSYSGTLTCNGNMSGATYAVTFGGAGNTTYAGVIGTTTGTLTKDGVGTLTLSNTNTYQGLTTISAGVAVASNVQSFGTTAGNVTVASGAAVQLENSITVGSEALTLNGTGISNGGALRSTSGTNIWQGNLTLNSNTSIGVDADTLQISGSITGGSSIGLTKVGVASLTVGTTTLGGDLNISAGTLVANGSSTISVGGSWINSATFTPNSSLVTFNSGSTGKTIDAGGTGAGKSFYDVTFNNSAGGWTIGTSDMKVAHNLTITDVSDWTVDSGRILEVGGTYSIADAQTAKTTWTGSTFYLNGTSQTVGSKAQSEENYATLQIGASTDIRMWNSSAGNYTVDSTGSLYSQDHDNQNGDLYIWGDYHTLTNDYWSYATDFDGTALSGGNERAVEVKIDPSANVNVDSGDTLAAVGTASAGRTLVSRQGTSNGYSIISDGGTINFQYADLEYLDGDKGLDIRAGSTMTSLDYCKFNNLVSAGASDAFITVDSTVIGSAQKTLTGVQFDDIGGGAEFNVNRTGSDDSGYWNFNSSTGDFDGEDFDGDDGVNEADPGMIRWASIDTPGHKSTIEGTVNLEGSANFN
jgi:autotransporter-associated beta strand protein